MIQSIAIVALTLWSLPVIQMNTIGRLPRIAKLDSLLPALVLEYQSPSRTYRGLWALCNDIRRVTTQYDIAVTRVPSWQPESPGAAEVLREVEAYARETFPALLAHVAHTLVSSHTLDRFAKLMYRCLMQASWVLQLHHSDTWPPCLKRCPKLAAGVCELSRHLGGLAANEGLVAFETALELCASVVYRIMLDDGADAPISRPMLERVCASASAATDLVLRNTLVLPPDSSIPRCLTTFVVAWHDLPEQQQQQLSTTPSSDQQSSSDPVVAVAMQAVTATARCDVPETCELLKFFSCLAQLHRNDMRPADDLAGFSRSLLTCVRKYPVTTDACTFVLMQRLRQCFDMRRDAVSVWGCAITACLRRSLVQMRMSSVPPPRSTLSLERKMLAYATQAAVVASHGGPVGGDLAGFRTLVVGLSMPGAVAGFEALLRGALPEEDPGHLAVVAALSIMKLILTHGTAARVAASGTQLLGLAVTTRKLTLCMISQNDPDVDWGSQRTEWLVDTFIRVMGTLVARTCAGDADSHRMYVLAAVTLQPLMRNVMRFNADAGRRVQARLRGLDVRFPLPPDVVSDPTRWSCCAEAFVTVHGQRLLRGCGSLACVNLAGTLDSMLETSLCTGCRRTRYCGAACQRADWGTGGHGRVCGRGMWAVKV